MVRPNIVYSEQDVIYSQEESREDEKRGGIDSLFDESKDEVKMSSVTGGKIRQGTRLTTLIDKSAIPLSPNSSSNNGTSSKNKIGTSCLARRWNGIPGCDSGALSKALTCFGKLEVEGKVMVPG